MSAITRSLFKGLTGAAHHLSITGTAGVVGAVLAAQESARRGHGDLLSNTTVVRATPWYEKSHESHHNKLWGYGKQDYPPEVQALMTEAKIGIHSGKLRWGEVIDFDQQCRAELKKLGVNYVEGRADIAGIKLHSQGLFVPVSGANLESKDLTMPPDTIIHVAGRGEPRQAFPGCLTVEDLSAMDPKDVPEVVILHGAGLSAAWVVDHFPTTNFVILKRVEDNPLSTAETGEWWKRSNVLGLVNVDGPDRAFIGEDVDGNRTIRSPDLPGGEVTGVPLSALGFEERKALSKDIPLEQRVEQQALSADSIIAPRILQPGSFMHSLYEYMRTIHSPHHIGITTTDDFTNYISEHAKRQGLEISDDVKSAWVKGFAERIRPLDHMPLRKEVIDILKASYEACEADPSKREMFAKTAAKLETDYARKAADTTQGFKVAVADMRSGGEPKPDAEPSKGPSME